MFLPLGHLKCWVRSAVGDCYLVSGGRLFSFPCRHSSSRDVMQIVNTRSEALFDIFFKVFTRFLTIEPQSKDMHLLTCAHSEDSNQPARPRSLISLRCPRGQTLIFGYPMRPGKILIRLRECAG